jgi:hypothetical protein
MPLPSPVGALIGFYEGVEELSTDDKFLLSVLWNLAHAEAERDTARALAEERAGVIARLEGDKRVLLGALEWVHSAFSVYDRTLMDRTDNQRQAMDNLTETLRDIGRRAALAAVPERGEPS